MTTPVPEVFIDCMLGMQSLSGQCARLTLARQVPNYQGGQTGIEPMLHLCLPAALLQEFIDAWQRMQDLAKQPTPTKQ